MNHTPDLNDVLIRSVERQELQCDLCEWRWLVPEWDENDVWSVAMVAKEHWNNNHERSER